MNDGKNNIFVAHGACASGKCADCICWDFDSDSCHAYDCEDFVGFDDESEELHKAEMVYKENEL